MSTTMRASHIVGTTAPAFALPDPVTRENVALTNYAGKDVLLVFLRGTWCPFCVKQLQLLQENFDRLAAANIAVLAVICQSQITVRHYLQQNPLPFPLLCDGNRAVAKAYGTHYWLSYEGFNLSHPALFILDAKQTVTFAHVGRSMSDLPLSTILEKFLGLLGSSPKSTE